MKTRPKSSNSGSPDRPNLLHSVVPSLQRSGDWGSGNLANTRTELAIAKYRKHAARYDSTTRRTEPLRRRTIGHLRLRPGDAVLDVACGTGLSFALIQKEIGASGKLIGIEQCPQMMERARRRANAGG